MTTPDVYGLVLAGGQSRRMGTDKAALMVDGASALQRTVDLLQAHCERTFVSVRAGHSDPLRASFASIQDRHGGVGPADGIASALASVPDVAWLVVACDLPRLNDGTLGQLLKHRDVGADVTAYRSVSDDLPEPLCAVFEPRCRPHIEAFLAADVRCARKMLLNMNTHLVSQPAGNPLDNMNTPSDWSRFESSRGSG